MFDVLSRHMTTNSHLLVEASAGTGKTFTIEHLFIRRLLEPIEGEHVAVQEIALLTFTKACAKELVLRIRQALSTAIQLLSKAIPPLTAPEYIQKIYEEGDDAVRHAKKRLIDAKNRIDEASISTIHSFAGACLSEYFQDESSFSENCWLTSEMLQKIIQDYFEVEQDAIGCREIQILLKSHDMQISKLVSAFSKSLWNKKALYTIQELENELFEKVRKMGMNEEAVLENLDALSTQFCDCRNRQNELKSDLKQPFMAFSKLFSGVNTVEEMMRFPLIASDIFVKPKSKAAWNTEFLSHLKDIFDPIIQKISGKEEIFARQSVSCEKFVTKVLREKRLFTPPDLLLQMQEALLQPEFMLFLQKKFKAVFVDEFQDTDPIQWQIFSETFLTDSWTGFLYLVGDPKQAIYAFRNADVYSYMKAKMAFTDESKVSLTSNFRSAPKVTSALNTLFSGPHAEALFFLPELNKSLDSLPVHAKGEAVEIQDTRGAIHFFIEATSLGRKRTFPHEEAEKRLFSFIAEEIISLSLPLQDFAVLVKDRYQAARLTAYLQEKNIGVHAYRQESIVTTEAYAVMKRLFQVVKAPKNKSLLLHFLIKEPFCLPHEKIIQIKEDLEAWAGYVEHIIELRTAFVERGLSAFSERFFSWAKDILSSDLYLDLEHLFELLIDEESARGGSLDALIEYLEGLETLSMDENESLSCRYELNEEKVSILTMHKSKGLEFDVVFALGCVSRSTYISTAEEDAEKIRQLYVAATRAKRRLYLPLVIDTDEKRIQVGAASPMELFLTYVVKGFISDRDLLYNEMRPNIFYQALDILKKNEAITSSEVSTLDAAPRSISAEKELVEKRQSTSTIIAKPLFIDSFSSLAQKNEMQKRVDISSTLPDGGDVGTLLHALLAEVTGPEIDPVLVEDKVGQTVLDGYQSEVQKVINGVFDIPFKRKSQEFYLRDIDFKKTLREVEFFYYENETQATRGVIDFAFEYKEEFYLIDWKSHLLEDYSEKSIKDAVSHFGYEKQAHIYINAFKRYLENFGIDPQRCKGLFFVFLRGPATLFVGEPYDN